jgi:plasmid stabilization system protein ParE
VKRQVRVLRRAEADLFEIRAYLNREAPASCQRVLGELLDGFAQLGALSNSGPVPRDEHLKKRGYRFLVRGRYVIFYKVIGRQVRIHRVLMQRRAYRRLL